MEPVAIERRTASTASPADVIGSSEARTLWGLFCQRVCRTPEEVEEEIRNTLLHETGHFFGLSEEDLEAMGLGWNT